MEVEIFFVFRINYSIIGLIYLYKFLKRKEVYEDEIKKITSRC